MRFPLFHVSLAKNELQGDGCLIGSGCKFNDEIATSSAFGRVCLRSRIHLSALYVKHLSMIVITSEISFLFEEGHAGSVVLRWLYHGMVVFVFANQ